MRHRIISLLRARVLQLLLDESKAAVEWGARNGRPDIVGAAGAVHGLAMAMARQPIDRERL